ncbi:MAG: isoprenylcysteine carboxylmethyltransferase family protein [Anaerolineales bacterium]|nr:isoprenylcysteine carboxylmethyltransferase family protein [Anaerolineales bacterium]
MPTFFKTLFFIGLLIEETIRTPHRKRQRKEWREKRMTETRTSTLDFTLDLVAFSGMEIIPILYVFTSWFNFADYTLPAWVSWLGAVILVGAVWLLWRAHADLGHNWTPTLQIVQEHKLVTHGIYKYLRHPIYAAVWLTGVAQVMMLGNWIAGPACLALFLPVFLVRVPREEKMMLDQFGAEYRAYMQRVGGVIPKVGSKL